LVDRMWPRAMKKESLKMDGWLKEVAPSKGLCPWFGHDPARWADFRRRYVAELKQNCAAWAPLLEAARAGPVTLVYSPRDTEHNHASVLKDDLEAQLRR